MKKLTYLFILTVSLFLVSLSSFAQIPVKEVPADYGVTRNIILDKTGKIVYLTRLYKEDEFAEMVKVIDILLK